LAGHRAEVRALAAAIVDDASARIEGIELGEPQREVIIDAAIVACYGRAGVERDGYGRREISSLAVIEEPPRLASQLSLLARSLLALGLDGCAALALCRRCALDSVPRARLGALTVLADRPHATIGEVARAVACHRHVARMALEELEAIGIAQCLIETGDELKADTFTPHPWSLSGPDGGLLRRVLLADDRGTKSRSPTHEHTHSRAREGMF
jgi:hypothetical protein